MIKPSRQELLNEEENDTGEVLESVYRADDGTEIRFPILTVADIAGITGSPAKSTVRETLIAKNRERCFQEPYTLYSDVELDDMTDTRIRMTAEGYVGSLLDSIEDPMSRRGILFLGPPNCGKTWTAAWVAGRLVDAGYKGVMTSPRLLESRFRDEYGSTTRILRDLGGLDFVVIDDMFRNLTRCSGGVMFDVIDTLYCKRIPLVVTSNVSAVQMYNPPPAAAATAGRLLELCEILEFPDADRRKAPVALANVSRGNSSPATRLPRVAKSRAETAGC